MLYWQEVQRILDGKREDGHRLNKTQ